MPTSSNPTNSSIDMKASEFKDFAKEMTDYIANYLETIRERPTLPKVKPGYLAPLIPETAPEKPESWQDLMADIERVIMPGVTHWHSPRFHAYFPSGNSYPAIVADMLSGAIGCIGFSWIASPACTELEVAMLNWLGKMINLPEVFLASSGGKGGGIIQSSASESTLIALLGAKAKMIQQVKVLHPDWEAHKITSKLVGYCSTQAHSSVERAGLLGGVLLRHVPADENFELRGEILDKYIQEDIDNGLFPFYIVAALGTTNSCAFDNLEEIGLVAKNRGIWLHIDAAYAGSAFICPEYRYLLNGVENADSYNFNPHKWLKVNFDCSAMWLKDPTWIVNAFNVNPLYLQHENQHGATPDFRHWQIPLGRRFRALKLWFVLRLYGIENLQAYIRDHCALAKQFEALCRKDDRFEIIGKVLMGLVCFRLKGSNELNEALLRHINGRGKIHMVPAQINDIYFIRMVVCSGYTVTEDMEYSWAEVSEAADEIFELRKKALLNRKRKLSGVEINF